MIACGWTRLHPHTQTTSHKPTNTPHHNTPHHNTHHTSQHTRFGRYLEQAVPLVVQYGHKAAEGDDELREYVLQVNAHLGFRGEGAGFTGKGRVQGYKKRVTTLFFGLFG